MKNIVIDIETIPDQREGALIRRIEAVTAPAQYKKPESIEKWLDENRQKVGEESWLKTSFDGAAGEIVAIAWAVDDQPTRGIARTGWNYANRSASSERALLRRFFRELKKYNGVDIEAMQRGGIRWIGHNVQFDLGFLYKRCVINGVSQGRFLPWGRRHGHPSVYCTMEQWAGWRNYIKLYDLAAALNTRLNKLDGMDAGDVWPLVQKNDIKTVKKYNRRDVIVTRQVYRKLTFEGAKQ